MLKISKYSLFAAAVIFTPALVVSDPAQAISYGKKMTDGLTCRHTFGSPHVHWGEGSTRSSQAAAYADALVSWSAFTRLEYGSRWKDWNIARSRSVECSGGGAAWKCLVKAMPCKY